MDANQAMLTLPPVSNMHYYRGLLTRSPNGYMKIFINVVAAVFVRMLGYDPRCLEDERRAPGNVPAELVKLKTRVQRNVDAKRVAEMVGYLVRACYDKEFADWGPIELTTAEAPDLSRYASEGLVGLPLDAQFFVGDGQHRSCAIMDFVRAHHERAAQLDVCLGILCVPSATFYRDSAQAFSDKGWLQKPLTRAQAIRGDSNDLYGRLARELGTHETIKVAGGISESTAPSLKADDPAFAPTTVMYKFVRSFVEGRRGLDAKPISGGKLLRSTYPEIKAQTLEYVDLLTAAFPSWTESPETRKEFLTRCSAVLQALGVLGHEIFASFEDRAEREKVITAIGENHLDWSRTNVEWGQVLGLVKDGKVIPSSARPQLDALIVHLRERAGLMQSPDAEEAEPQTATANSDKEPDDAQGTAGKPVGSVPVKRRQPSRTQS